MSSLDAILADARAAVAAGHAPDAEALRARIRTIAGAGTADERRALERLERVLAVHRARARLAAPAPALRPRPRGRSALRTRPTVSGNMDVRRGGDAEAPALAWDPVAGVVAWEVRLSERPDPRRDYVVREQTTLPATATSFPLPLGDQPLRLHLLGRDRNGRLVRRAIVSALTRENWRDRWQRRATAA